jgi:hypothetical protein
MCVQYGVDRDFKYFPALPLCVHNNTVTVLPFIAIIVDVIYREEIDFISFSGKS